MKVLRTTVVISALLLAFWLFAVDTTTAIPPHAIVLVDPISNSYFAPPLIGGNSRTFVVKSGLASLIQNGIAAATKSDEDLSTGWSEPGKTHVWLNLGKSNYSWDPPLGAIIVNYVTVEMAENAGASPDQEHESAGGFLYTRTNLTYYLERASLWSCPGLVDTELLGW